MIRQIGAFLKPPFEVANAFGLSIQVAQNLNFNLGEMLCPDRRDADAAERIRAALGGANIHLQALHAEFPGTTYASLREAIAHNGLTQEETRLERSLTLIDTARFAKEIGADRVGLHPGYITWENFDVMVRVLSHLSAVIYGEHGLRIAYESGPIAPDVNAALLKELQNKGHEPWFNLDPSNMLQYRVAANRAAVLSYARDVFGAIPASQVTMHAKNGCCGQVDHDQKWLGGKEVGLESDWGEVDFPALLQMLDEHSCQTALVIEREIPGSMEDKAAEVDRARDFLLQLM